MRRHGAPSQRVKAVVNFMLAFYGEKELVTTVRRIAQEACDLGESARSDHYALFEQILKCGPSDTLRNQILRETPSDFLTAPDAPVSLRGVPAVKHAEGTIEKTTQVDLPEQTHLDLEEAKMLFNKGVDLHEQKEYAQAVSAYDDLVTQFGKAKEAEVKEPVAMAIVHKSSALFAQKKYRQGARSWEEAEQAVDTLPQEAWLRDSLAWCVCENRVWKLLPKAKGHARKAVAIEPDDGRWRHTLASLLYLAGDGAESLKEAELYLTDRKAVEKTVEDTIDLFVGLAATGHGSEGLRILRDAPSADLLEPLVVGLRLYLGEDVKAAAEITEVAKDVVQRIDERRVELDRNVPAGAQRRP